MVGRLLRMRCVAAGAGAGDARRGGSLFRSEAKPQIGRCLPCDALIHACRAREQCRDAAGEPQPSADNRTMSGQARTARHPKREKGKGEGRKPVGMHKVAEIAAEAQAKAEPASTAQDCFIGQARYPTRPAGSTKCAITVTVLVGRVGVHLSASMFFFVCFRVFLNDCWEHAAPLQPALQAKPLLAGFAVSLQPRGGQWGQHRPCVARATAGAAMSQCPMPTATNEAASPGAHELRVGFLVFFSTPAYVCQERSATTVYGRVGATGQR